MSQIILIVTRVKCVYDLAKPNGDTNYECKILPGFSIITNGPGMHVYPCYMYKTNDFQPNVTCSVHLPCVKVENINQKNSLPFKKTVVKNIFYKFNNPKNFLPLFYAHKCLYICLFFQCIKNLQP